MDPSTTPPLLPPPLIDEEKEKEEEEEEKEDFELQVQNYKLKLLKEINDNKEAAYSKYSNCSSQKYADKEIKTFIPPSLVKVEELHTEIVNELIKIEGKLKSKEIPATEKEELSSQYKKLRKTEIKCSNLLYIFNLE